MSTKPSNRSNPSFRRLQRHKISDSMRGYANSANPSKGFMTVANRTIGNGIPPVPKPFNGPRRRPHDLHGQSERTSPNFIVAKPEPLFVLYSRDVVQFRDKSSSVTFTGCVLWRRLGLILARSVAHVLYEDLHALG